MARSGHSSSPESSPALVLSLSRDVNHITVARIHARGESPMAGTYNYLAQGSGIAHKKLELPRTWALGDSRCPTCLQPRGPRQCPCLHSGHVESA